MIETQLARAGFLRAAVAGSFEVTWRRYEDKKGAFVPLQTGQRIRELPLRAALRVSWRDPDAPPKSNKKIQDPCLFDSKGVDEFEVYDPAGLAMELHVAGTPLSPDYGSMMDGGLVKLTNDPQFFWSMALNFREWGTVAPTPTPQEVARGIPGTLPMLLVDDAVAEFKKQLSEGRSNVNLASRSLVAGSILCPERRKLKLLKKTEDLPWEGCDDEAICSPRPPWWLDAVASKCPGQLHFIICIPFTTAPRMLDRVLGRGLPALVHDGRRRRRAPVHVLWKRWGAAGGPGRLRPVRGAPRLGLRRASRRPLRAPPR